MFQEHNKGEYREYPSQVNSKAHTSPQLQCITAADGFLFQFVWILEGSAELYCKN